jgi:hypothetical protein
MRYSLKIKHHANLNPYSPWLSCRDAYYDGIGDRNLIEIGIGRGNGSGGGD